MNTIEKKKNGGARAGAGRPKGSTNKLNITDLLDEVQKQTGLPLGQLMVENYVAARNGEDKNLLQRYDQMFLNKFVADKQEIEIIESEDVLESKKLIFAEAIAAIANGLRNEENK
jgi:hypothetical protein